jgi:hypothetical protein
VAVRFFIGESLARIVWDEQGEMGTGCDCEGDGNRSGECQSGTRLGSTQHPLHFLRTHSRAKACAVEMLDDCHN